MRLDEAMRLNERVARAIDDAASVYEGVAEALRDAAGSVRVSGDPCGAISLVDAVRGTLSADVLDGIIKAVHEAQSRQKADKGESE